MSDKEKIIKWLEEHKGKIRVLEVSSNLHYGDGSSRYGNEYMIMLTIKKPDSLYCDEFKYKNMYIEFNNDVGYIDIPLSKFSKVKEYFKFSKIRSLQKMVKKHIRDYEEYALLYENIIKDYKNAIKSTQEKLKKIRKDIRAHKRYAEIMGINL